jgi:hypothetical protein
VALIAGLGDLLFPHLMAIIRSVFGTPSSAAPAHLWFVEMVFGLAFPLGSFMLRQRFLEAMSLSPETLAALRSRDHTTRNEDF